MMFNDLEDHIDADGKFSPPTKKTSGPATKGQKYPCAACGGSGRYLGARVHQEKAHCFACKGLGSFRSSEYDRQKASAKRRQKKADDMAAFREANADLIRALVGIQSWNNFAASLLDQAATKPLSDRQILAAERLLDKIAARREEKAAAARREKKVEVDLRPIRDMFETAVSNGYQKPTYRAEGVVINRAPNTGSNPGALYVKTEASEYQGKVVGIEYTPIRAALPETLLALQTIAADPLAAALRYGQRTGRCACCGRKLTNHVSIDLGIGPICRDKWGL